MKKSRPGSRLLVQTTLGHVVVNTEGGRKVIGRWNRPNDFDHLIGDLLDMSTCGRLHASIWTMAACRGPDLRPSGCQKRSDSNSEDASSEERTQERTLKRFQDRPSQGRFEVHGQSRGIKTQVSPPTARAWTRRLPYWDGARKSFGSRLPATEVVLESFWLGAPAPRTQASECRAARNHLRSRSEVVLESACWYRSRCEGARLRG